MHVLMLACICVYLSGSLFRVWVRGTIRCLADKYSSQVCVVGV